MDVVVPGTQDIVDEYCVTWASQYLPVTTHTPVTETSNLELSVERDIIRSNG